MIIIDGVRYNLWTPKDEEKQFHPMVREQSKEIFGENSLYFDVKRVLKTVSGIGSIPDAYVINLSKPPEWYVVENELASHPVYDHVVKQLTKFINGIENQNARSQILEMLYEKIDQDDVLKATVKKLSGSDDIHFFLSKLLFTPPRIVIVIDQKTPEVQEACRVLKYPPDIIEFKTYARENAETVHAHIFEPLRPPKIMKEEKGKEYPEYRTSWQSRLSWVTPETREIVHRLINAIESELPKTSHQPKYRWLYFYKGEDRSVQSLFAVFMIGKKKVNIRIAADPAKFADDEKWTKKYKGWFFPRKLEEREFSISTSERLDYAMKLIKQSYDLTK